MSTEETTDNVEHLQPPEGACIVCGVTQHADQRVKVRAGWLCAGCLESEAYARGQAAASSAA